MNSKRRRVLGGIICITCLLFLASLLHFFGSPKRINSLFVDGNMFSRIVSEREEDNNLDLSSLKVNNYAAFVADNTIYYSIIENDKYAYNPSISIESSYKIALFGDYLNEWYVENNTPINVLIYNDSTYRQLQFVATTLPMLSLDFEDGSVPEDRTDEKFSMRLFDNREKALIRTTESDGKAHKRGGISFNAPKANLSIKLTQESPSNSTRKNSVSLLGMEERSNYVLAGMYYDFEQVRDAFNTTLWRDASSDSNEFGLDLSYDWRYVEVIANGEYYGLYMLGYKPDESTFQVNTEGEHPDILFKAADGEDFSDFILGNASINAGYELESDTDLVYSYDILREYMRAMYSNDISKVLEWSDYNNAVDFWLFTNVTQNKDITQPYGMVKNSYICFKWNGEHYRAVYIPWDHDISFGTISPHGIMYNFGYGSNAILDTDMIAAFERTGDYEIEQIVTKRYNELRQGAWSNSRMNELIDNYEKQIFGSGAFLRNQARWPESNHVDAFVKLDQFRTYVAERFSYTDDNLFNYEDLINTPYTIPNYITVYLETGEILSPDDPEYLKALPEECEDELYCEVEAEDEDSTLDELIEF